MKIGILQTGHALDQVLDTLGEYDAMFARLLGGHGFTFEPWAVVDGAFPKGPDTADGWLITGSRHGAYEDHPWIPPLEILIRDIYAAGQPLIGVCFGHQIIAQALGGRVEKYERGWSVGRQTYDCRGRAVSVNAWHQDQVVELPPGAEVIARSDFCRYAGFVMGDGVWTIQPHPEFDADMVAALLEHRAPGVVPPNLIDAARKDNALPNDRMDVADEMAAFLKRKARHG